MKRYNRRLLAVLLAAMAVFALVGSATASAAVWKDAGVTVSKAFTMNLSGAQNYEVENSAGGVQCSEKMTISFNGVSTTKLESFKNESCTTFGTYKACTVQTVEAIGSPWTVTLNASNLSVASFRVKHTFKAGCAKGEINQLVTLTMTPDNTEKFTTINTLATSGTFKQFGTLTVETPTYGIG